MNWSLLHHLILTWLKLLWAVKSCEQQLKVLIQSPVHWLGMILSVCQAPLVFAHSCRCLLKVCWRALCLAAGTTTELMCLLPHVRTEIHLANRSSSQGVCLRSFLTSGERWGVQSRLQNVITPMPSSDASEAKCGRVRARNSAVLLICEVTPEFLWLGVILVWYRFMSSSFRHKLCVFSDVLIFKLSVFLKSDDGWHV